MEYFNKEASGGSWILRGASFINQSINKNLYSAPLRFLLRPRPSGKEQS